MQDDYTAYIRRTAQQPVKNATRASILTARLRAAIIRGDLKPGQKVNLDQLRAQYNVSLSPLREAISRLSVDGLVKSLDQRGSTIAPLTLVELNEIVQLRREVDVYALREAIKRGGDNWKARLRGAAVVLHSAATAKAGPEFEENWSVAHTAFHSELISGCKMPLLIDFCLNLHDLQDRYQRQLAPQLARCVEVWRIHAAIATHAVNGEADSAALAFLTHFDKEIVTVTEQLSQLR
ncbi:DNA-binding GntR family transcriptional regulator [Pacificibacter maritimus]|uniref:DNA-binding GntR family transcriptional regulator n=1 Tax=Pacificibacter maritimus TaxID=762213 RepID=A0A3N4V2K8_9RHOB|nr:DNA-binding GntR family transcriptional regulator [Pacificibacter maritimus]